MLIDLDFFTEDFYYAPSFTTQSMRTGPDIVGTPSEKLENLPRNGKVFSLGEGQSLELYTCPPRSRTDESLEGGAPLAVLTLEGEKIVIMSPQNGASRNLRSGAHYVFGRSGDFSHFLSPELSDFVSREHFSIDVAPSCQGETSIMLRPLNDKNGTVTQHRNGVSGYVLDLVHQAISRRRKKVAVAAVAAAVVGGVGLTAWHELAPSLDGSSGNPTGLPAFQRRK